jgi:hypothetical protein
MRTCAAGCGAAGRKGGRGACGRPRGVRPTAGRAGGSGACGRRPRRGARVAAAERAGGRGACGRLRDVRAAMGRAGGRCASGHAGGSSGARGRPRGVRAVPREGARRAGRETGCPGNGGKRGLVRGQTSVMAATECVGNALFRVFRVWVEKGSMCTTTRGSGGPGPDVSTSMSNPRSRRRLGHPHSAGSRAVRLAGGRAGRPSRGLSRSAFARPFARRWIPGLARTRELTWVVVGGRGRSLRGGEASWTEPAADKL